MRPVSKSELLGMEGWESEPGEWFEIDQERVDRFAEATLDRQFIHVDPERAAKTPLGGTIAHGFLTLSLLPYLSEATFPIPEGLEMAFNYGLNKVRFPKPVPVGGAVRLKWEILDVREQRGKLLVTARGTLEIRGERRPGLVAETLTMFVMKEG